MELLSFRAYAKLRGVSPEAVSKAVRQGRISTHLDDKGQRKINPEVADKEWGENTDHGKRHRQGEGSLKEGRPAPSIEISSNPSPEGESPQAPPMPGAVASLAQSRAIKEAYEARIKKLDYEEKLGKLIDADKVRLAAFKTGRVVRDSILNVAHDISGKLASETDPKQIHIILTKALTEALEELTRANKPE